jgi:hypothetical protein
MLGGYISWPVKALVAHRPSWISAIDPLFAAAPPRFAPPKRQKRISEMKGDITTLKFDELA